MSRHPDVRKASACLSGPIRAGFGVNGQISARVGRKDLAFDALFQFWRSWDSLLHSGLWTAEPALSFVEGRPRLRAIPFCFPRFCAMSRSVQSVLFPGKALLFRFSVIYRASSMLQFCALYTSRFAIPSCRREESLLSRTSSGGEDQLRCSQGLHPSRKP